MVCRCFRLVVFRTPYKCADDVPRWHLLGQLRNGRLHTVRRRQVSVLFSVRLPKSSRVQSRLTAWKRPIRKIGEKTTWKLSREKYIAYLAGDGVRRIGFECDTFPVGARSYCACARAFEAQSKTVFGRSVSANDTGVREQDKKQPDRRKKHRRTYVSANILLGLHRTLLRSTLTAQQNGSPFHETLLKTSLMDDRLATAVCSIIPSAIFDWSAETKTARPGVLSDEFRARIPVFIYRFQCGWSRVKTRVKI